MTFLFVDVKVEDFTKDFNNKDFIKDFTIDFTNFYGFVKKMVQKKQYTYVQCLMGRVGRLGRVGRVGWVDGPEKCPFNFFILCGYIDYVYVYLYTK